MTAVIDYGVGNLFSIACSLKSIGEEAVVTKSAEDVKSAARLILPGVGAFEDAAARLRESGLVDTLLSETASGKPLLGICLGMQLLFDSSEEYGLREGLHLIPGVVRPIADKSPADLKIPHIGWNALRFVKPSPIYKYVNDGEFVYFVHSYYADCDGYVTADTEYGAYLTASVQRDNVYGCQFHPEKSGRTGLNILRAFCEL